MRPMKSLLIKKILPPIVPYITVSIGLLVFHNAWIAILSYHVCMVAVITFSRTGFGLNQIFPGKRYWILFITALVGASGGITLYLIWPLLSVPADINLYVQSVGLNEQAWPAFLAYFVLINPWIEEYYWRGCFASPARGITLNDFLFSGYHLIVLAGHIGIIWLLAVLLALTLAAWFWRQMNRLNGGLLASIVSHMAADVTVILTIFYLCMK
jgi:hypothetical protein